MHRHFSLFLKNTLYIISRKPKTYGLLGATFFILLGYTLLSSRAEPAETVVVKTGPLTQYVLVTGSVQATREANLAFQTLGVVSYIGVKVGDEVTQGKVLATLDAGDAQANLLQAKSNLENAEATLSQLRQGSRPEEIAIKQQALDNTKNSLDQAYIAIPDVIRSVDTTIADVIKNKLSSLFTDVGDHYVLSFSSCDQTLQSQIETSRTKIETTLSDFQKKNSVISVISSKEDIDAVFDEAYKATLITNDLINQVSRLLFLSCSIENTSLDNTRTTLSSVRTTMNALFSDITTKRSALSVAKNAFLGASRDLDFIKSGTDPYKVKAQMAQVSSLEAQVAFAEVSLHKTIITAPFSGTIGEVTISSGETVTSGKVAISMLATDAFEIEAKVPEIDIIKITQGKKVEVTLDAYGKGIIFPAVVSRVNPTATVEGSVPMYKVVVTFLGKDTRIKSGMTANVKIITQNKLNVLSVPARFVIIKDKEHGTVTIRRNNKDSIQEVKLGTLGEDGSLEILTGLVPDDVVVAPLTGIRSSQKQTQ